jgi:hypothetical protein
MFGVGSVLTAADARAPGAQRERGIRVAAELLPQSPPIAFLGCAADESVLRVELRFERITSDPDADEMRLLLSHGMRRAVEFDWNSDTGELGYAPRALLTLPAAPAAAASPQAPASCVSR